MKLRLKTNECEKDYCMKKGILFIAVQALCSAVLFAGEGLHEKTLLEERAEAVQKEQAQRQTEERKRLEEELKLHEQQQKREMPEIPQRVDVRAVEKQKNDVLNIVKQFDDAYQNYKAGKNKEGDAVLFKIDGKDLLSPLSTEQLAKIISTLQPDPQKRFAFVSQLADVNIYRENALRERPTLVRLIAATLDSLTPENLKTVLADKKMAQVFPLIMEQLKSLAKSPVHFLPETPAEEVFYGMISLAQRLATVMKVVPEEQKKRIVDSLVLVIRSVPKGSDSRLLKQVVRDVPIRFLPRDYESARELLPLLAGADVKNQLDASALLDMKEVLVQGARKKGSLAALREALRLAGSENPEAALLQPLVAAQNDYLKLITTQSGLRQFADEDNALMVEALISLTAKKPSLVADYVTYLLRNVPTLIATLEAESKGRDLDAARKKTLEDRAEALTELYERLPALLIPDYKMPEVLWKEVVAKIKKDGETLEPVFFTWKPERLNTFLFGTPEGKSSDAVVALKRFIEVYDFYVDFPDIQKKLFVEIQRHYKGKPFNQEEWNQLLEAASYDGILLRFMDSAMGRTVFGPNSVDNFIDDLRKRALLKAAANDRRPLLNLIPFAYQLSEIAKTLLSYKEGRKSLGEEILYKLLADVPEYQFSVFLKDIKKSTVFGFDNLPVLLKAVSYLQSERAKLLIDTMIAAKKEFEAAETTKSIRDRITFSVTQDMLDEATATYTKNLKQAQEKVAAAKQ